MNNVVILGPGRTGSSLLSGLISKDRFYINREAIESRDGYPDGDYENPDLVALNKSIFFESGYGHHKIRYDRPVDIQAMAAWADQCDADQYKQFIAKCEANRPWLWKDPRLCYTIYFWKSFVDLKKVKLIFITRDHEQIFRSYTKYKVFFTKQDIYRKYDEQVAAVERLIEEENLEVLRIHYNELKDKKALIQKLNAYLGTDIQLSDYDAVRRTKITKKESEIKFWIRYGIGVSLLKIQRFFKK